VLKKELFLLAMKAGEYRRKAFVISIFALINEAADDWKKKPYPYRVVQTPTGYFFIDPENNNELTLIEDGKAGEPLFTAKETVTINGKDGVNNYTSNAELETTYGRLLFNFTVLIYAFNNKLPYINVQANPRNIEEMIIVRFKDNPKEGEERKDEFIYVDEYIKFCDGMFYLAGFTQLCVPAATRKTITGAPGIAELRNSLLEENKDRLYDPAVIAKIDAELVAYDRAYLKGDLGEGFLINNKSVDIVRKRLYGMYGAETGLEDKIEVELIRNSLSEGWDINKFPAMNNSLRAGSFNRGASTALGGEAVKWLYRASSNINVVSDDCGSVLGIDVTVSDNNYKKLIGFSVVTKSGSILVENEENAKSYIGKKIMLRSPMFCKLDKTDFCKTCVGVNLANNPTGISVAVSDFGSAVLAIFMKMTHGKKLALAKMDYKKAIS